MAKSKTLLQSGSGKQYDKLNEGDLVIALQCNRKEEGKGKYRLETNIDWSFDDPTTPIEIKSFLGGILGAVEEIFGEKMVTEAIMHYAHDMGHIINTPKGPALHLRSKGIEFKPFENYTEKN